MASKTNISRQHIDQFTSVIRLPPDQLLSPTWLEEQQQDINRLHPSLLQPRNFAVRIMNHFSPHRAVLCQHHKKMNPIIVRTLWEYIHREVNFRIQPFEDHPTAPQKPRILAWKKRIIGINSLWTERESFYHIHNAQEGDPVRSQIKNNCEACILARIGGDEQMLNDLYVSARGRGNYDRKTPQVSYMVESWLDAMGRWPDARETLIDFWREIRSERARMQRERRIERRRNNKERPTYVPDRPLIIPARERRKSEYQPPYVDDDDEIDAEQQKVEIIDFYARRLSAMPSQKKFGKHGIGSRLSVHPAIGVHLDYDAETGKYSRQEPDDMPAGASAASVYKGQLGRSNTTISRDSRWDPMAWAQYRSESPVSDDSRRNSREDRRRNSREYRTKRADSSRNRRWSKDDSPRSDDSKRNSRQERRRPASPRLTRRRSKDNTEYSDSVYSRPSKSDSKNDINDSGYYDSSSVLSARDVVHEKKLRMNPTGADISTSPIPSEVARNRKDAYSNLVGMASAYEFEALATSKRAPKPNGMKTVYEFEPDTEDELEIDLEAEQNSLRGMKANSIVGSAAKRTEEGQQSRGRTSPRDEVVETDADGDKRTTKWDDFYNIQKKHEQNDERRDGRKRGDKKNVDGAKQMKKNGR